jgi:hypothetical protein
MSPAATAMYLGEQLRTLRGEIARLEQLADQLALSAQSGNLEAPKKVTASSK